MLDQTNKLGAVQMAEITKPVSAKLELAPRAGDETVHSDDLRQFALFATWTKSASKPHHYPPTPLNSFDSVSASSCGSWSSRLSLRTERNETGRESVEEAAPASGPKPMYGRTKSGRKNVSEAKAEQEAKTRQRHIAKIQEVFEKTARNLNKYSLTTQEAIVKRLEGARNRYDEGDVFQYQLTKQRSGKFLLSWLRNILT